MKKKMISAIIAIMMLVSCPVSLHAETKIQVYQDIAETDWYYEYVNDAFRYNWMTGMGIWKFGPCEILSRAQFATILYRIEGKPETTGDAVFSDIPQGEWYADAVLWAAEQGIVTGYEDGSFGPADVITREQMAVMLHRYAGYRGYNMMEAVDMSTYPDAIDVSDFARGAVSWCVAKGIINGSSGFLNPQGQTSRAECATMIGRFADAYQLKQTSGDFIVSYADQFVGYPYEWGGINLLTGVDCSHFVYEVLKDCGVYDGEYVASYGWRTKGVEVPSLEEAQAGDVICYSGHVAIYDGKGYLVEAKGEAWGITHDREANCKTIITIRRFI